LIIWNPGHKIQKHDFEKYLNFVLNL
jgi:hypothetical protein